MAEFLSLEEDSDIDRASFGSSGELIHHFHAGPPDCCSVVTPIEWNHSHLRGKEEEQEG